MSPPVLPPSAPVQIPRRRSSWAVRFSFALAILGLTAASAVVVAMVGFAFLQLTESSAVLAEGPSTVVIAPVADVDEEVTNVWDRHGPINVLLIGEDLGLDQGCQESTYRLTDTLILVRFDPQTKRAGMMSIPRDLYVPVRNHGARKITTAHAIGEGRTEVGGAALLKHTIESSLEVPVHRYIRVDIRGFERIVDELGGVEVDVPPSPYDPSIGLRDPGFPDGSCGTIVVEFAPGPQVLDGERALQYARSRKTTSDFDRSRRQMDVLMGIRAKATSPRVITSLPGLLPALLDTVDTDFTTREILALAAAGRDVGPDQVQRYPVDYNVVYDDKLLIDGVSQDILRLKPQPFRELRDRFVALQAAPATPAPGTASAGETGDALVP